MSISLDQLAQRYPGAKTFCFGDNRDLSARLLDLVRSGRKTATTTALRDVETGDQAMPVKGRRDIALDWDGAPAVVIETTAVHVCRFDEVSESFAVAEGEDDDLAGWRHNHKAYFERSGGFSVDMKVICERFRVVEVIS